MVNVITNLFVHKQYLNNNQEFFDQIYAKFPVEQFHHNKNLHMSFLFRLDKLNLQYYEELFSTSEE